MVKGHDMKVKVGLCDNLVNKLKNHPKQIATLFINSPYNCSSSQQREDIMTMTEIMTAMIYNQYPKLCQLHNYARISPHSSEQTCFTSICACSEE